MFNLTLDDNTVFQAAEKYMAIIHPSVKPDEYQIEYNTHQDNKKMETVTIYGDEDIIINAWSDKTVKGLLNQIEKWIKDNQ